MSAPFSQVLVCTSAYIPGVVWSVPPVDRHSSEPPTYVTGPYTSLDDPQPFDQVSDDTCNEVIQVLNNNRNSD